MNTAPSTSSASPHKQPEPPIRIGDLSIYPESRFVVLDGEPVSLTRMEFRLLWVLARQPTRVFSKSELLGSVWAWHTAGETRTLDVHASRLRRKLGAGWLINVWGVGYRLTDPLMTQA